MIIQVSSLIFSVKESGLILVIFADLNPNSNVVFLQKKQGVNTMAGTSYQMHTHIFYIQIKKLFSHCKIAGFQEIGYLSNIDLMRGLSKTRIRTSSLIRISTQCLKVRHLNRKQAIKKVVLYNIWMRRTAEQLIGWMDRMEIEVKIWMEKDDDNPSIHQSTY